MKAVILAAGQGKRLRPITETIPKAMASVCGKPMLEIILRQLKVNGITDAILVIHYKKEQIKEYFGEEYQGIKIHYAEQKEMKGTGDAVLTAEPFIDDDHFLVVAADTLAPTALFTRLNNHKSDMVITVCKVQDPTRFGVIETDNNHVTRIVEKSPTPPTNLASASVYYFPKTIFDKCKQLVPSPRGEYEITDAIQMLLDEGVQCTYEIIENWLDIGTHEQLAQAQEIARQLFTGEELSCQ